MNSVEFICVLTCTGFRLAVNVAFIVVVTTKEKKLQIFTQLADNITIVLKMQVV